MSGMFRAFRTKTTRSHMALQSVTMAPKG